MSEKVKGDASIKVGLPSHPALLPDCKARHTVECSRFGHKITFNALAVVTVPCIPGIESRIRVLVKGLKGESEVIIKST
ncbi:hypothetical protein KIPB_010778 [Kipferlia bialata]|uniref:Uncharacterized protein n=1 Tax=Kipferlia bialata TaxID=797122 RepID=A0A9K3GLT6_9EUKA|nr:hypothetical protein KIPB_010778 [Kipferlia bialata]|eukprot:g10778.t1